MCLNILLGVDAQGITWTELELTPPDLQEKGWRLVQGQDIPVILARQVLARLSRSYLGHENSMKKNPNRDAESSWAGEHVKVLIRCRALGHSSLTSFPLTVPCQSRSFDSSKTFPELCWVSLVHYWTWNGEGYVPQEFLNLQSEHLICSWPLKQGQSVGQFLNLWGLNALKTGSALTWPQLNWIHWTELNCWAPS